jgi:hypothetical protein
MYVKTALAAIHWVVLATLGIVLGLGLGSCKPEAREGSNAFDKAFSHKAEGVDLNMTVRGTDISLAGLVEIVFDITHASDMDVAIAESDDWQGELGLYAQVAEPGRIIDGGKRIVRSVVYSLEPQRPGDYEVDKIKIDYWHTDQPLLRESIRTEAFSVHVYSLLTEMAAGDANSADILDIEGPWVPQEKKSYGAVLIMGVVLCACVLMWYFSRETRKEVVEQMVEMTPRPGERALADLKTLLDERLCEQGLLGRFFVRLSDIMRQYIASRFNCPVVSQTTEEFLTAISRDEVFDKAHKEMLRGFLTQCDEVKFAGIVVRTEVAQASSENCRCLIVTSMEGAG